MRIFLWASVSLAVIGCSWAAIPSEAEVASAFKDAREINLLKRELDLLERDLNYRAPSKCPLSLAHGKRLHSDERTDRKVNNALLATRILLENGKYRLEDLGNDDVKEMFIRENGDSCDVAKPPTKCDNTYVYRRADGACNNEKHTEWGMAGRSQERIVENSYDDGIGKPRTSGVDKKFLPNPRTVSNAVHRNEKKKEKESKTLTLQAMGFGQFLDHDITLTPEQGVIEDCCLEDNPDIDLDYCFNIIIPEKDKYQKIFTKGHCMEVKRSAPVLCADSTSEGKEIRQQKNSLTSFVDASNVYGSSEERQKELRDEGGKGYLLATTETDGKERILDGKSGDCNPTTEGQTCSAAGDVRVNEVPCLTSYHFLFVREHNRIANKIKDFYPADTEDEKEVIFQKTRKIVIAILQKIAYIEFLSSFLSEAAMSKYKLTNSAEYKYEPGTNPTVINAFSTAAYRVGHTWVSQEMILFDKNFKPITNLQGAEKRTETTFFDPKMTYLKDGFSGLARWLSGASSVETDSILEDAVRNRLFENIDKDKVKDLAALNIQRGRDHGLASYAKYREWCGLKDVTKEWGKNPLPDHSEKMSKALEKVGYKSPLDIDLFVGGITESAVRGGELGPTFECIIAEQFRRLKFGDRFWYENKDAGFNKDQIKVIEEYTFSKLICNNYDFDEIQYPSAFLLKNKFKKCSEIPDLDLKVFDEGPAKKNFSLEDRLEELIEELEKEDK